MPDWMSFFDFAMDIVCMMPPLDEVDAITLTRDHCIYVSLGAISLLVLAITISALKQAFPANTALAVVAAVCVVGIAFLGLDREMLKSMFLVGYPAMVIALRFGAGAIIGGRTARHLHWWHSLVLAGVVAALYYLLKPLPNETLALARGGWALFGAGLAAFFWTRMMRHSPIFQGPFSIICIFAVFASTLVYVSASPFERTCYQWALPLGLVVGIAGGRVSAQDSGLHGDRGSATDEA